jgi:HD-like signal output (HDOD) protein
MLSPGARRIVQEALKPEVSVAELAQFATADPAFAVRILSVANSAAYTRGRDVTNVTQACALLGIRGLRNIALGMLVADLVPAAEGAASLLSNCLRRAVIARDIASFSGAVTPDDGFFAGLLLEVGLLSQACDSFEECLEASRAPARHRLVKERAAGLIPHPDLGRKVAEELSLPDVMVDAISDHHQPIRPKAPLSAVCWVAEHVAGVLEAGDSGQNLRVAEMAVAQLRIPTEKLSTILEKTPEEVFELAQALDCPGGPPQSQRHYQRPAERDLAEMHREYASLVDLLQRVLDERDRLKEARFVVANHDGG